MLENQAALESQQPSIVRGAPAVLRQLGRYELIAELGGGGMAVVYLAVARGPSGFKKLVVVKVLREAEPDRDSDAEIAVQRDTWLDMFLTEARLAARLNHPNVVQTIEAGDERGRHYIVMEYLDGRSLQNIHDRERELGKRLPYAARVLILADALAGLQHAHELTDFDGAPLGVVHRDVSPQNIFVTFDGRVKVLDFGIAKLSLPSQYTETGVLKGKVRYMSPEQAMGEHVDRATDIFGLGLVLWEALAERSIWQGKNEMQILQVLLNHEALPTVISVNSAVPERLSEACMKALEYRPEARFASCAEFRDELLSCLKELQAEMTNEEVGLGVAAMFVAFREQQQQAIAKQLATIDVPPAVVADAAPVSQLRARSGARWLLLGAALTALGGGYAAWRANASSFRADAFQAPPATSNIVTAAPSSAAAVATAVVPAPALSTAPLAVSAPVSQPIAGQRTFKALAKPVRVVHPARSSKKAVGAPSTDVAARPVPAAAAPSPAPSPAAGARMQLDTANPWSNGASPAKP